MRPAASLFRALLLSANLSVLLSGCFEPDLPAGQFKCDQPGDSCPDGMACLSGLCQSRDDDPGAPSAVDMAMTPTPTPTKGCAGTGVLLARAGGKDAHACSGSFPNPSSSSMSLCAAGYHVCKSTDSALLFDARASGRCDGLSIPGFFAADVAAGYDIGGAFICEPKVATATPALVGCGSETGTHTLNPPCVDLIVVASCNGSVSGWSCTSNLSNATHAAGMPGGVLCCQN